jgi:hypothetical protein
MHSAATNQVFGPQEPSSGARGRLLLLSYHFPPARTAGALRWQKMARYAAERGWQLDVLALSPADSTCFDPTGLDELPRGTRVFGVRQPTPAITRAATAAWKLYRSARSWRVAGASPAKTRAAAASRPDSLSRNEIRWRLHSLRDGVRALLAWVDYAQNGAWARDAARLGQRLFREKAYDAVISCGPPHMAHEAGRLFSRRTGALFVMDLRDPWSLWQRLPESYASPVWLTLARYYERRAVRTASLVCVNTEPVRVAMQEMYPEYRERIITVMNGYDEERPTVSHALSGFKLAYAGTVYIDRDPRPLFRAAARVVAEFGLSPAEFRIEFMGDAAAYRGQSLGMIAEEAGIRDFVKVHPPAPRQEALEFLADATMLLSLPQDSDMAIPSKIFEYMQFDAWILALARPGSATELALRHTEANVVAPDDEDSLAGILRSRFLEHRRGVRPEPLSHHERFSRATQARVLFDALDARLTPPVLAPEPLRSRPSSTEPTRRVPR